MFYQSIEEQIQKHDVLIKEFKIRNERLSFEQTAFNEKYEVNAQQVREFVKDQDNFSKENWETLEKLKKEYEDNVSLKLVFKNRKNSSTEDRAIKSHWIQVR